MKIAPIDIAHKNFKKGFMGFDQDEVMEFLRQVADEMEDIIRERNSLKEDIRERELQIMEYKERDKVLRDTITTAQTMSDRVREDADREAKLIIDDANHKADIIVKDARDSLKSVYQEITDIKRAKIQFENHLRALVSTHLKILDQANDISPRLNVEPSEIPKDQKSKNKTANNINISPVSTPSF